MFPYFRVQDIIARNDPFANCSQRDKSISLWIKRAIGAHSLAHIGDEILNLERDVAGSVELVSPAAGTVKQVLDWFELVTETKILLLISRPGASALQQWLHFYSDTEDPEPSRTGEESVLR